MSTPLPPSIIPGQEAYTVDEVHGVSLWRGAARRMRRNPSAIIGAAIVLT